LAGVLLIGAISVAAGPSAVADNLGSETKLPIPRFVSLRSNEVNMRTGPGTIYPVEWVYVRRGLPVEVIAEFDVWRRIRDWQGTMGWVHQSMLDGRRTARITGADRDLRNEPAEAGSIVVRLAPGVIGRLLECDAAWCKIDAEGYRGWLRRDEFWGTYPDEQDLRAGRAKFRYLIHRERKMDELNGGGLALGARAIDVGLRHACHRLLAHANESGVLDAAETGEEGLSPGGVVDLEEDRGHQLAAVGNERVVGAEFIADLRFAALFDVQHLLHLQPHAVIVLEMEGRDRSDLKPSVLLPGDHRLPTYGPHLGVFGGRHEVFPCSRSFHGH
jgi:SH3-like domain-containing protein